MSGSINRARAMEKFIDMLIKKRENLIGSHPSTENYRQLMGTELAFLGMSPLLTK